MIGASHAVRVARWLRALARDERGVAVVALLVIEEIVSLIAIALIVTPIGLSPGSRLELSNCQQAVDKAAQSLKVKYPAGTVPIDDIDVLTIQNCAARLDSLVHALAAGNSGAIKNLSTAISSSLRGLDTCRINGVEPGSPVAGVDDKVVVAANIALNGIGAAMTSTLTVAGSPLTNQRLVGFFGSQHDTFSVPKSLSLQAAGTSSTVTITARSNVGPFANGSCPAGTDADSPPGTCFISCTTPPFSFVWSKAPQKPDVFFTAFPPKVQKGAPTPIILAWAVKNATAVSIEGLGDVPFSGQDVQLPPDSDTIYKLTATGANGDKFVSTAKVEVEQTPLVTLTFPGNNSNFPGTTVAVTGTVQNARPGDLVDIRVNGASRGTFPVSGGAFSTSVALDKTVSFNDLALANPSTSVTANGSVNTPVTLSNNKSRNETRNEITAAVVGVPTSLDARVVFHTVLVDRFIVDWLSCPPLNKNEPLSFELGGGQSAPVGTVSCGVPSGGFCQTCSVRASARTSVGTVSSDATWTFDVKPCP